MRSICNVYVIFLVGYHIALAPGIPESARFGFDVDNSGWNLANVLHEGDLRQPSGSHPLVGFDFTVLDSPEFKEDAVREEIIHPVLNCLGYAASGSNRIIRSKSLQHPFLTVGSNKRPITLIPDYLLMADKNFTFVLDAKAPSEEIKGGHNVEQVYSYATHPEIRVDLFALCNGREFILFDVRQREPLMYLHLNEVEHYWGDLVRYLSPNRAIAALPTKFRGAGDNAKFDYLKAVPPLEITRIQKQTAKRHFGVHGYFTKQVWSVVQNYIKTFTRPGDIVLDPFGGSGVTLVEALVLGRKAIHIDINPLSEFLVRNLIEPIDLAAVTQAFHRIKNRFNLDAPRSALEVTGALGRYPYPTGIALPKTSDVATVDQLFSRKQLAQLAYLAFLIRKEPLPVRGCLMLMFSGLLNKVNLTYHSSEGRSEGRGDSSVFRYYRYRIAPVPAEVDPMTYFESRFKKVIAGKQEIAGLIDHNMLGRAQVVRGTATDLSAIKNENVDYIYTDPPYGSKIPYLDLSVMWNAWLGLAVSDDDYKNEAIEGGDKSKSRKDYCDLIAKSIREMARVLKYERWLSFVFAHKDPGYWHLRVRLGSPIVNYSVSAA